MRTFLFGVVCSLAIWGCESDVDLCGGGAVCGVDGNPYGSYCEAGSAGVDVAYAGACNDTCSDIMCRIDCQYGLVVEAGCPVCACAPPPTCMNDAPCTRGDVCVDGRCAQPVDDAGNDAGTDAPDDAVACPLGQAYCDGACTPLGTLENCAGCGDACDPSVDVNGSTVCKPDEGCAIECNPGYGDCDDDGFCELLDQVDNCGSCGNVCARFASCTLDSGTGAHHCECPPGRPTICGGTCVNTSFDGRYCGGCASDGCARGQRCQDGVCTDGDACTNPANWSCSEGDSNCDVRCGDIFFYGDPETGGFACEGGGTGISCFLPIDADCASCIDVAARCCFGG